MSVAEVAIWSAACGAVAMVVIVCLIDALLLRTRAALQGLVYNVTALVFVVLLSGLPVRLGLAVDADWLHAAQVLVGPLCVLAGDLWVRKWLAARHRDRLMDACLLAAGTLGPLAGLATFLLPPGQRLPAAAAIVLLNTVLVVWMSVRAWLLGDALALGIAIGCVFMLPALGGLYAVALGVPGIGALWQTAIAFATVACVTVIGFMLWKRNRHERRTRGFEPVQSSQYDAVTKLPGGAPFVQQLVKAQQRRKLTRRDGAVIAVLVFAPERLLPQVGATGLNEAYVQLAQRLQRQVGVVNPVGRYWDRCFVALVEAIHGPSALRTLGLRIASSLRRPFDVKAADGHAVQVRFDIGVGVVHMGRGHVEVDDLLHEAQHLAEAARAMPSRAAIRDPATGDAVAVELARLGPRKAGRSSRRHEGGIRVVR